MAAGCERTNRSEHFNRPTEADSPAIRIMHARRNFGAAQRFLSEVAGEFAAIQETIML
jgi:hypothetical protein